MSSRIQSSSDGDLEAAAFANVRGRRHRDNQLKFFTIAEVAERLRVSTRTVRRWIKAGDLIAHRVAVWSASLKAIYEHFWRYIREA